MAAEFLFIKDYFTGCKRTDQRINCSHVATVLFNDQSYRALSQTSGIIFRFNALFFHECSFVDIFFGILNSGAPEWMTLFSMVLDSKDTLWINKNRGQHPANIM